MSAAGPVGLHPSFQLRCCVSTRTLAGAVAGMIRPRMLRPGSTGCLPPEKAAVSVDLLEFNHQTSMIL